MSKIYFEKRIGKDRRIRVFKSREPYGERFHLQGEIFGNGYVSQSSALADRDSLKKAISGAKEIRSARLFDALYNFKQDDFNRLGIRKRR